jgi:chemotaxis protein CheD
VGEHTETFLHPGDFCFAGPRARIHTVLGSCVSITLWHPVRRIGGMCHYLLPGRGHGGGSAELDGRYGDEAIQMFLREVHKRDTRRCDYQVKMFGGAGQFPQLGESVFGDVAARNIDIGMTLLQRHGFTLTARHLGGVGSRRLIFELATGGVWLKSQNPHTEQAVA